MLKYLQSILLFLACATGVTMAANRPLALEGTMGPDSVHFRLDLAYDGTGLIWGTRSFVNEFGEVLYTHPVYGTYNARMLASDRVGYMTVHVNEYDNKSQIIGQYTFDADECDNYKNKTIHKGGMWTLGDQERPFNSADIVVARPMLPTPNGDLLFSMGNNLRVYKMIQDTLSLKNNQDIIYQSVSSMKIPAYQTSKCQHAIDTLLSQYTEKGLEALFKVVSPTQWYPHTVKVDIDSLAEGQRYVSLVVNRRLFYHGALAITEKNCYTFCKENGMLMDMQNLFINPNSLDLVRIIKEACRQQRKIENIYNEPDCVMLNPAIVGEDICFYYRQGEHDYHEFSVPVSRLFGFLTPFAKSIFTIPRQPRR